MTYKTEDLGNSQAPSRLCNQMFSVLRWQHTLL